MSSLICYINLFFIIIYCMVCSKNISDIQGFQKKREIKNTDLSLYALVKFHI